MQWLMSQDESDLHKKLTVKASNKFRLQGKQSFTFESLNLFQVTSVDYRFGKYHFVCPGVWDFHSCSASERSKKENDNINTTKGCKSLWIWKPRLTIKEGTFRK